MRREEAKTCFGGTETNITLLLQTKGERSSSEQLVPKSIKKGRQNCQPYKTMVNQITS
jgi:hypothetical protein